MLVRPVEYGADIVVHSLTKFMGGHGTTLGGIIVDCGTLPVDATMRRAIPCSRSRTSPITAWSTPTTYGAAAFIGRCRSVYQRTMGAVLSPMNAFLLLQGIETVALRIDRHVENARKVAEFLRADARVESVNFAGFADNPYHALVQKYLGGRACSLMTFEIRGGLPAGMRFYNALKLFKRLVNLGDAKSLACHPASTTHRQMSPQEQLAAGVAPGSIRLSVGIEHIDDILADLDQALGAAGLNPEATCRTHVPALFPNAADRARIEQLADARAARRRCSAFRPARSRRPSTCQQFRAELQRFDFERRSRSKKLLRWTIERMEHGIVQMSNPRYFGLFNPGREFPRTMRRSNRGAVQSAARKFGVLARAGGLGKLM